MRRRTATLSSPKVGLAIHGAVQVQASFRSLPCPPNSALSQEYLTLDAPCHISLQSEHRNQDG